jgi:hypothetical protein
MTISDRSVDLFGQCLPTLNAIARPRYTLQVLAPSLRITAAVGFPFLSLLRPVEHIRHQKYFQAYVEILKNSSRPSRHYVPAVKKSCC